MRDLNNFHSDPMLWLDHARDINDYGSVVIWAGVGFESLSVIYAPQPPVKGDADGTCRVNVDDLLLVINQWGAGASSPADLDESGLVDVHDLILVINHWTEARP